MMRAIRDNEEAANAMGKNVVKQHLLIFILGSAIVGIAGAMLVPQDGLFTQGSYRPKGILPEKIEIKKVIMKYIILGAAIAWAMYIADKYMF